MVYKIRSAPPLPNNAWKRVSDKILKLKRGKEGHFKRNPLEKLIANMASRTDFI
jgi:hypothetical protein